MKKRRRIPAIAYGVLAVSLISSGIAFGLYRVGLWYLKPYANFKGVVAFFFAVSIGLSFIPFFAKIKMTLWLGLVCRLIVHMVLIYSFGEYPFIGMFLVVGLLFESGVYQRFPLNLVVNAVIIAAATLAHRTGVALLSAKNIGYSTDLIVSGASLLSIGLSTSLLTLYRERLIKTDANVRRLNSAVAELTQTHGGLMRAATTAKERSTEEERNRITREIHDTIGYTLTNVSMMLEAAQDLSQDGNPKLIETLKTARDQTRVGLDEIRKALHLLREKEEEVLVGVPALQRMIQTFTGASGIDVDAAYGNIPMSGGTDLDSTIYHFVQEGLTNAFRHGHATRIRIALRMEDGYYHVSVRDNGDGSANIQEGIGMLGMRERLGKLGGTLTARNLVDGFEIAAAIPKLEAEY